MSSPSVQSRSALLIILGLPLLLLFIVAVLYHHAIKKTELGKLNLVGRQSPYPPGQPGNTVDRIFGVDVPDPYRWLEDGKSPAVIAWAGEQNKLARAYLDSLTERPHLLKRFRQLYDIETITSPLKRGTRYFYSKRKAGQEKAVLYWREGLDGPEQSLVDPNALRSAKNEPVSLGAWSPTYDGKNLAYSLHPNNADEATLYVKDIGSGAVSAIDAIKGAKYAYPSWTPDGAGFYYTWLPPAAAGKIAERPGLAEVRFHRLGTDPKTDFVIHPKTGDPQTFIGAHVSRDGRWLFLAIDHGWTRNDLYYQDLKQTDHSWKPLVIGKDALFQISAWKDQFYILTNDHAPRFRIYKTSSAQPRPEQWKEIIPERPDSVIESYHIVGNRLVLTLLHNAASAMEIHDLDGGLIRPVDLPGIGSLAEITGNPDEPDLFYEFSNFTTPPRIYRGSVDNAAQQVWAEIKVPVDPSQYVVEQVWYPSKDGAKISMFLVHHKRMKRDGRTPFLLTGYGGFNVNMEPGFGSGLYPWLEAGGGYAIPNLRGGGEYGEEWHRAGMLRNKQNVFDDFIAAAEYLVAERYTRPDRLAIRGGSNGGLLVGAALIQRPDLFRAVICAAPLLDMVRYPLFGSGTTWVPEYGSPRDAGDFKALYDYSPYHHVKSGINYPAILLESSADDDRVDPMHARKMAAALQAANTGEDPILMRVESEAGHGGSDAVQKAIELSTDGTAFIMHYLGLRPVEQP
jgi:prolyl oligopeptidase